MFWRPWTETLLLPPKWLRSSLTSVIREVKIKHQFGKNERVIISGADCGERGTLYIADRNMSCCKSHLGCVEFYVYIFWPMIQEALVHKKIYTRIFLAMLFVLAVHPPCLERSHRRQMHVLLTHFLQFLAYTPSLSTYESSKPSPARPSFKPPAFCSPGHSIPCDILLFYFLMHSLSVSHIRVQIP